MLSKIITYLCLIFILTNCYYKKEQTKIEEKTLTKIQWNNKTIDFGKVKNDTIIKGNFYLYNLDTIPLIIKYVNPECSCTNYSVSQKIVSPHDSAEIILHLDTKNKKGYQRIITTVCTNTKQKFSKLTFKGIVE